MCARAYCVCKRINVCGKYDQSTHTYVHTNKLVRHGSRARASKLLRAIRVMRNIRIDTACEDGERRKIMSNAEYLVYVSARRGLRLL